VLYLGRAVDLRRRVASYWGDLAGRRHLRVMVSRIERVEAVVCDSAHEAAWLEHNLLRTRRPPWNRSRGEEVPVQVRLDTRPRSTGLAVVHVTEGPDRVPSPGGVELFGPYLGGVRTRLAVAGLQRVLPLAYAADGLSGSEVDLGRVLWVDPLDRESLLATVRRILDRDPEAVEQVRRGLVACRDAAVGALRFERAGQVQAELEALEWLAEEQKVALLAQVDLEIAGWADDVLVRFEIRDGRLCSWKQSRCSSVRAAPYLAATPPAWTAFARRTAELAAALASARDLSPSGS